MAKIVIVIVIVIDNCIVDYDYDYIDTRINNDKRCGFSASAGDNFTALTSL